MAFTYLPSSASTETARISRVRLALGDTVESSGVLPDGSNLSDAEISVVLAEYEDDIDQTVGALCGVLARHWSTAADIAVGPRRENLSQVSKAWQEQANGLNPDYGAFVAAPVRSDGYSENADSTSEYA